MVQHDEFRQLIDRHTYHDALTDLELTRRHEKTNTLVPKMDLTINMAPSTALLDLTIGKGYVTFGTRAHVLEHLTCD